MNEHDYREYLRSDHWRSVRCNALESTGYRSADCGRSGQLEVHHIDYKHLVPELPDDVQVKCRECHQLGHLQQAKCRDCGQPICPWPSRDCLSEYPRVPHRCVSCHLRWCLCQHVSY